MIVDLNNTYILYHIVPYYNNTTNFETTITWPFFKLGAPNVDWQQIQTIPIYYIIPYYTKVYPNIPNTTKSEIAINPPFLNQEFQILCGNRSRQYPHTIPYNTILYHTIPYYTKYHQILNSNNLAVFKVRSSKFCMVVDLDNTYRIYHEELT